LYAAGVKNSGNSTPVIIFSSKSAASRNVLFWNDPEGPGSRRHF
jgi:hypothetical protein